MIVKDPDLMIDMHDEICYCERCDTRKGPFHCHHIWARGMGGGSRLDVRINLIILCVECHNKAHSSGITKRELWGIAAEREINIMRRS